MTDGIRNPAVGMEMVKRASKGKAPALVTHRDLAREVGVTPGTIRKWCGRGVWPRPHSIIERTWMYRRSDVDHYVATGGWPDGVVYFAGEIR